MPQTVRRRFVDISTGQAHLREAGADGDRPPIVCLHMVPKSGRSFARLLPLLADGRRAIAPDLPGYGDSDPPTDPASVSIADYAAATWDVIDALALPRPVHFVGYHTGAMVAVAAASRRPGEVARLVNISAPLFTPEEVAELRAFFAPLPLDEAGSRFRIMWERILRFRGPGMTLPMAAASLADNLRAGEDYEEGHRAAFDHAAAYARELGALSHPLLVMNIDDDLVTQTRRVDALLANGERREYPDWGNGFLELWPEAVAAELLAFLDADADPDSGAQSASATS